MQRGAEVSVDQVNSSRRVDSCEYSYIEALTIYIFVATLITEQNNFRSVSQQALYPRGERNLSRVFLVRKSLASIILIQQGCPTQLDISIPRHYKIPKPLIYNVYIYIKSAIYSYRRSIPLSSPRILTVALYPLQRDQRRITVTRVDSGGESE